MVLASLGFSRRTFRRLPGSSWNEGWILRNSLGGWQPGPRLHGASFRTGPAICQRVDPQRDSSERE
eukprot:2003262-Pyramimonas_sp.AAC.1